MKVSLAASLAVIVIAMLPWMVMPFFSGDDVLILRRNLDELQMMYGFYGKPTLAYLNLIQSYIVNINYFALKFVHLIIILCISTTIYFSTLRITKNTACAVFATTGSFGLFVYITANFAIIMPYFLFMLAAWIWFFIGLSILDRHPKWLYILIPFQVLCVINYEPLILLLPAVAVTALAKVHFFENHIWTVKHKVFPYLALSILFSLVGLIYAKFTPMNGIYKNYNPMGINDLVFAFKNIFSITLGYLSNIGVVFYENFYKYNYSILFFVILYFALMVLSIRRSDQKVSGQIAVYCILFGLALLVIGLFPFVVANKIRAYNVSQMREVFFARHFIPSQMGMTLLSITLFYLLQSVAIFNNFRLNFYAFLIAVAVVGGNTVSFIFDTGQRYLTRALLTSAVFEQATNVAQLPANANKNVYIDGMISRYGYLLSSTLWMSQEMWRLHGGSEKRSIVVSDKSDVTAFNKFAKNRDKFAPHYRVKVFKLKKNENAICIYGYYKSAPQSFYSLVKWMVQYHLNREKFTAASKDYIRVDSKDCRPKGVIEES